MTVRSYCLTELLREKRKRSLQLASPASSARTNGSQAYENFVLHAWSEQIVGVPPVLLILKPVGSNSLTGMEQDLPDVLELQTPSVASVSYE